MGYARAVEAMRKLTGAGGPQDYGPDRSRLLTRVMRTLAQGRPVSEQQVDQIINGLEIAHDEADQFLREVTERDAGDSIVGIMGLSLNATAHRFSVGGTRLWSWCAVDTLFLPALLQQTATVESESPVSGGLVSLTVSPQGVEDVTPSGAVVSIVIVDPDNADTSSVEATRGTFCCHMSFFASRDEAERWAVGRDDIEILSVDEAFALSRQMSSRFLAYGS